MSKDKVRAVFQYLFGPLDGFLYLARIDRSSSKPTFEQHFFKYPDDLDKALDLTDRIQIKEDMYFCPTLFREAKAKKKYANDTHCVWADLDDCDYKDLLVRPSLVAETSPGRQQAFWKLNTPVPPEDAELVAKRIAYYHRDQGADLSGWDFTQLLRIPFTKNFKYEEIHDIKLLVSEPKLKYNLTDFGDYPQTEELQDYDQLEMPDLNTLPSAESILEDNKMILNPIIFRLYGRVPENDWSNSLWQLECSLLESGISAEHTFAVVNEAACNKYARDGRQIVHLWQEVVKAAKHVEYTATDNSDSSIARTRSVTELLTDDERMAAAKEQDFVARYIDWATSLGDAAPQYHQAGAFIVLSSLLAGSVRLPTSFGHIMPNMWFMILADTTLTRKTTAMDIAIDLVREIDKDAVLATDGTIEGLMQQLQTRPNRASVFLRDEVTGLIEAVAKKDYYSGMLEALTKLYDGKFQKRLLKREEIVVEDPVLIFFAGGIKSKMWDILGHAHISSGFLPRFVMITAEADVTKIRPLGPPTDETTQEHDDIVEHLEFMYRHYAVNSPDNQGDGNKIRLNRHWNATMTPDAWARYNQIENLMVTDAMDSHNQELLTPTMDRLAKSGLKAAILIAASEKTADKIVIEERHIVRAFYFVEKWRNHTLHVIQNVGLSDNEKLLQIVYEQIKMQPNIPKSDIMRRLRLNARETDSILETLEQRDMIGKKKDGRVLRLRATME